MKISSPTSPSKKVLDVVHHEGEMERSMYRKTRKRTLTLTSSLLPFYSFTLLSLRLYYRLRSILHRLLFSSSLPLLSSLPPQKTGDNECALRYSTPADVEHWSKYCQIMMNSIKELEKEVGAGVSTETLENHFADAKMREKHGLTEEEYSTSFKLRVLLHRAMPDFGLIAHTLGHVKDGEENVGKNMYHVVALKKPHASHKD